MESFLLTSIVESIKNMGPLVILPVMFGIFYFMVIRPQQKQQRIHDEYLKSLKKGDEIVTNGGIFGKVAGISEKEPFVTLELQEKVRIRVLRSSIAGKAPKTSSEAATQKTEA